MRKRISLLTACMVIICNSIFGQQPANDDFPIKSLCIAAPSPAEIDSFVIFINNELPKRKVNTLFLRIDYNYQYKSHPELVADDPLSLADIKKISAVAAKNEINIIPQINLLGHQSWSSTTSKLLSVYPEFDETPWVKLPAKYEWPNADSLYCKSYCPLHPEVHKIVFDLVDELCDAFGAQGFHAGMDEVFYIGMDKCPRCGGKNKAELFAGEVKRIRDHLKHKNRTLYIWGDRLLDGYSTGLGMWEASYNNTYPAIDMIPKDVIICDWHYEQPAETDLYFAKKGFKVITATWNVPSVGVAQSNNIKKNRASSSPEVQGKLLGMMHTVWSSNKSFFQEYYNDKTDALLKPQAETFKQVFPVNGNRE